MTASQFFLVVLLAAFQCQTQAYDKVFNGNEDLRKVTKCSWNCKVIESDLLEKINKDFTKTRFIEVAVIYRMIVDEKSLSCPNQSSRSDVVNSSRIITEKLKIWRPADDRPASFATAFEKVLELLFPCNHKAYEELKADCNLTPAPRSTVSETIKDILLPDVIRGHLGDLEIDFESMNISSFTGNFTANQPKLSNESWASDAQIHAFFIVLYLAFAYYSPEFLCLFSPMVVTKNGIRHISLERLTSPVGLRNLISGCFYSEVGSPCHRVKKFIARTVLVPLPFIIFAIGFDYLVFHLQPPTNALIILNLSRPFQLVCFTCYFLQAVYDSFLNVPQLMRLCFVCKIFQSNLRCNHDDNLPRRILNHLRLQPSILVKCCRLFCKCPVSYFKISRVILPSCKVSASWLTLVLRVTLFIVFVSTIPAAPVILLLAMLVVVLISIGITSPIITTFFFATSFYPLNGSAICSSFVVLVILQICVRLLAIVGACIISIHAAIGFVTGMFVLFVLLFSEKNLPYVACFVLVCYYLWSSYSSFTIKHHDLSLMLYKFYKQSQPHDEISKEQLQLDDEEIDTPNSDTRVYEVTIPEGLFDMACEDLMPVREGVCTLLLKVTLILSFVYLTFLLILRFDIGATPVMQALATFFTGSFPKIIAIYFDGNRQRRYESTVIEEKVPNIVQNYMKGTPTIIEMVTFKDNHLISDQN